MSKMNVLIVEDEAIFAEFLKSFLRDKGLNVIGKVDNVRDALSIVKEQDVHLVLIDIYLKGKEDGIYLSNELKKLDIPFMFITAISDQETIKTATKSGAYGYIVKPTELDHLSIVIDIAISQIRCKNKLKEEKKKIEQKFGEMLDSLQLMMVELDLDYNIKFMTRLVKERLKLNSLSKTSFVDFFGKMNREIMIHKLERVKAGEVVTFNLFLTTEEKKFPVFFRCSPITEEEDGVPFIYGIRILMINIMDVISEFVIPDEDFFEVFSLSNREKEIVKYIIKFYTNQEIAKSLFISLPTVKFHIKNIYSKLKVKNRKELIEMLKNYYYKNYGNECYAMYLLNVLLNQ
ncbi:MAG: response regulator [Brevinematia bacterium]